MDIAKVSSYTSFAALVQKLGFMPFANNKAGYPNLTDLTDNEWHTGKDDDPWRWRVKIERDHKALFGKFFFGNPGFISLSRVTDFASVRRNGLVFDELFFDGVLPRECKVIYEAIEDNGALAVHDLLPVLVVNIPVMQLPDCARLSRVLRENIRREHIKIMPLERSLGGHPGQEHQQYHRRHPRRNLA